MDGSGGQQPDQPVSYLSYLSLSYLSWSAAAVARGKRVKGKGMPKESKLKWFRVLVSTHRPDDPASNELAQHETGAAEAESGVRWTMEPLHREARRLTGLGRLPVPAGPQPAQPAQPHRAGPAGLDPA